MGSILRILKYPGKTRGLTMWCLRAFPIHSPDRIAQPDNWSKSHMPNLVLENDLYLLEFDADHGALVRLRDKVGGCEVIN
jgi:hypothetical protein